jgi:hypothetical protein
MLMRFLQEPVAPGLVAEGMPADARIVNIAWEKPAILVLFVESATFEPIPPPYTTPPLLDVRFTGQLGGGASIAAPVPIKNGG